MYMIEITENKMDELVENVEKCLRYGGEDSGLTYSNVRERVSVLAVGYDDDKGSMVNTVGHELLHVVAHVCEEYGIDMLSEEPCYIMGRLCEEMYSII